MSETGLHIERAVAFSTVEVIPSGPGMSHLAMIVCMSSMTLSGGQRRSSETACDEVVGGEGGEEESVVKRLVRTLYTGELCIRMNFVCTYTGGCLECNTSHIQALARLAGEERRKI